MSLAAGAGYLCEPAHFLMVFVHRVAGKVCNSLCSEAGQGGAENPALPQIGPE